ncbi:hypothetical protein ACFCY8_10360 [Streptomyces noursei]|uniref:hypothetical protein n=1 Tax=Streptomyces noursei TaxID=1971 RepID=UPI0035DC4C03
MSQPTDPSPSSSTDPAKKPTATPRTIEPKQAADAYRHGVAEARRIVRERRS